MHFFRPLPYVWTNILGSNKKQSDNIDNYGWSVNIFRDENTKSEKINKYPYPFINLIRNIEHFVFVIFDTKRRNLLKRGTFIIPDLRAIPLISIWGWGAEPN